MNIRHSRIDNSLQQFHGIIHKPPRWDELSIGKPEVTDAALIKLAHLSHHFIRWVDPYLFPFHDCIDAIAAIVGATSFGLHTYIEVVFLQVIIEARPDLLDVVVIASRFFQGGWLLVN